MSHLKYDIKKTMKEVARAFPSRNVKKQKMHFASPKNLVINFT